MEGVTTMVRNITDKKELIKLVSFLVMCDGGVYTQKVSYRFIMNHTSQQYIEYAKAILENVTSVSISERKDYNTDGCSRKPQQRLETKTHPIFNMLRERIYFNGYKSVDEHTLKLMDAECLAILYMADGGISYKDGAISSITLNTKRLTAGDNLLLSTYIYEKFGIESAINRQNQYSYLRVKSKHVYLFFNTIKEFILTDFSYKLPNDKLLSVYKERYKDGEIV